MHSPHGISEHIIFGCEKHIGCIRRIADTNSQRAAGFQHMLTETYRNFAFISIQSFSYIDIISNAHTHRHSLTLVLLCVSRDWTNFKRIAEFGSLHLNKQEGILRMLFRCCCARESLAFRYLRTHTPPQIHSCAMKLRQSKYFTSSYEYDGHLHMLIMAMVTLRCCINHSAMDILYILHCTMHIMHYARRSAHTSPPSHAARCHSTCIGGHVHTYTHTLILHNRNQVFEKLMMANKNKNGHSERRVQKTEYIIQYTHACAHWSQGIAAYTNTGALVRRWQSVIASERLSWIYKNSYRSEESQKGTFALARKNILWTIEKLKKKKCVRVWNILDTR